MSVDTSIKGRRIEPRGPAVAAYQIRLTCPSCGGQLHHVNDRQPGPTGYSALAIVRCTRRACPEFELRVELISCGQTPSLPK